ncbi:hypothetical protein D0859_06022, partial [Hortaea werneckii]
PYSNFRVGCSILLTSGEVVRGANVENAAYPVGTCAERVTIGNAVTQDPKKAGRRRQGGRERGREGEIMHRAKKGDFRAIAVATDITPPASPCGMCRQFIREFCELNCPILMYDIEGKSTVMTLEQLLPMSFGPEKLIHD